MYWVWRVVGCFLLFLWKFWIDGAVMAIFCTAWVGCVWFLYLIVCVWWCIEKSWFAALIDFRSVWSDWRCKKIVNIKSSEKIRRRIRSMRTIVWPFGVGQWCIYRKTIWQHQRSTRQSGGFQVVQPFQIASLEVVSMLGHLEVWTHANKKGPWKHGPFSSGVGYT